MIAKCANPSCGAPFRYLREGRIFQVDRDPAGHRIVGPFLISDSGAPHRLEHFWLCGACARTMTLVVDGEGRVVAVARPPGQRRPAA